MNTNIFIGALALLGIFSLFVSFRSSKNSQKSYYLANRSLGPILLALSIMATQLGGGVILGTAEGAYRFGWGALLWPLGSALGLLAVGLFFGKRLRLLNISTIAEVYTKVYKLKSLRTVASILSIISLFLILSAQLIASKGLLATVGLDTPLAFFLIWSIVVLYTMMGGLKAVVLTDVIQALFIAGALSTALFFTKTTTATATATLPSALNGNLSAWFLMPCLFMIIGQDMGQRCFSGKNGKTVLLAFLLAAIGLALIGAIPVAFGTLARGLDLPEGNVLLTSVQLLTNPAMTAIVGTAVVVALISTVDSLLCAVSSNLALDFALLKNPKLLTFLVGLAAMTLAYTYTSITGLLLLSYELSVTSLSVSIIAALILKNPSPLGALLSVTLGTTGFLLFRFIDLPFREIATLSLSALGYTTPYCLKFLPPLRSRP